MKNIIVFYITFLLLSLGTSCSKKDKQVVYPVDTANIIDIPQRGEGQLTFNVAIINTSSLSINGNVITVVAGDKVVTFTFNNSTFAPNTYTTKSTVASDADVKVEIKDNSNGETYLVEDNSVVIISDQAIPNTTLTLTYLALATSTAKATVDVTRSDITVDLGVVK
jgi:hypothetical protein